MKWLQWPSKVSSWSYVIRICVNKLSLFFIFSIKTKAYIFTLACIAQTHVKILFSDSHGMKPMARNKIREYTKVLCSVLGGSVWLPALFFVQVVAQKCGTKSMCFY